MTIIDNSGTRVRVTRITFTRRPDGTEWPVLNLADGRRVTADRKSQWVELRPNKEGNHDR